MRPGLLVALTQLPGCLCSFLALPWPHLEKRFVFALSSGGVTPHRHF